MLTPEQIAEMDQISGLGNVQPSAAPRDTSEIDEAMSAGMPRPAPSRTSTIKDVTVGALKGAGTTALNTAKTVAQQGPSLAMKSVLPSAPTELLPKPNFDPLFRRPEEALQPSNTVQNTAYDVEQMTELFLPFMAAGAKVVSTAPKIARSLEEANLRLTPAVKRDLGEKIQQVTDFMVRNKIVGSPAQRSSQVEKIYQNQEKVLQDFLNTNNTAKGVFVPRDVYIQRLEAIKSKFRNSRDFAAISRQIDDAIENAKTIFRQNRIPISRFNEYKRSVFEGAYNKAGAKVLDDVEFAIGDAAKNLLEEATDALSINGMKMADFNKQYSTIINARKLLRTAESRNQVGLIGKLVSMLVGTGIGTAIGGPVGAGVGVLAGPQIAPVIAGTAARSGAAQIANTVGKAANAAKKVVGPATTAATAAIGSKVKSLLRGQTESSNNAQPEENPFSTHTPDATTPELDALGGSLDNGVYKSGTGMELDLSGGGAGTTKAAKLATSVIKRAGPSGIERIGQFLRAYDTKNLRSQLAAMDNYASFFKKLGLDDLSPDNLIKVLDEVMKRAK
jgi:hypothetical protein